MYGKRFDGKGQQKEQNILPSHPLFSKLGNVRGRTGAFLIAVIHFSEGRVYIPNNFCSVYDALVLNLSSELAQSSHVSSLSLSFSFSLSLTVVFFLA